MSKTSAQFARSALRWLAPYDRRRSRFWRFSFLGGAAICLLMTLWNAWTSELRPGSIWGMGYGIAAAALLVLAAGYAARRRMPLAGPGSAYDWLQLHLYGGALFVLLVLMHTGFRVPHGTLAWGLWLGSLWTGATGLLGVLVQKWIPRLLSSGLSVEAHHARIPALVEALRDKAEALVETADESIQRSYRKNLAALLERPEVRPIYLIDVSGGRQHLMRHFDHLRKFLGTRDKQKWDELRDLFETKLELDAHHTLQRVLRGWLLLHVPVSLVLTVLVGFHIFTVVYY